MEITLRTPAALEAIRATAAHVPEAAIGVGTCITVEDLRAAQAAGASFAFSPGCDAELLQAAADMGPLYLPGVATPSEDEGVVERLPHPEVLPGRPGRRPGLSESARQPLRGVRFCPTGGLTPERAPDYLALANVVCVGGSWLAPEESMRRGDWSRSEVLARAPCSFSG